MSNINHQVLPKDLTPLTVSVVIPTQNRPKWLRSALDSILSQTFSPLEIIVVDDASEDSQAYASIETLQNPIVRYIRNDLPLGPSGARNVGIYHAGGDLVAFLDDDDQWLPEKLEKQVYEFYRDPDVGAVYCPCKWRDLETDIIYPHTGTYYAHGWILKEQLIEDHTCGTPTYVVKRDLLLSIGCFDTSLKCREDWDLTIRLAERCKIAFVDEDLVIAGRHNRPGVSKAHYNLIDAQGKILEKYASQRKRLGVSIDRKAKSRYFAVVGPLYHYVGRPIKSAYSHLLGMLWWPLYIENYTGMIKSFIPLSLRRKLSKMMNS